MNENNNILQQMRTTFEELEKRIKAMERSIGINAQVTALVSYMQEVKSYLEQFEEEYSSHLTEFSEHTTDYNTFKQSTQNSINANNTTDNNQSLLINNLSTQMEQLSSQIITLDTKIQELEQSALEGGETSDCVKLLFNLTAKNSIEYGPRIYIIDVNKGLNKLNITVYGTFTSDTTITTPLVVDLYFGTTILKSKTLEIKHGENFECAFSHNFVSTNTSDYVYLVFNNATGTIFDYVEAFISGPGVSLLSYSDHNTNFYCFDNKYYVVDNSEKDNTKFAIIDKTNLNNLETSYTTVAKNTSDDETRIYSKCLPQTKLNTDDNTLEIDTSLSSNGIFLQGYLINNNTHTYMFGYSQSSQTLSRKWGRSDICGSGDALPYLTDSAGLTVSDIILKYNEAGCYCTSGSQILSSQDIKFNGTKIKSSFAISLVRNNKIRVGDNVPTFAGFLITDIYGNITYYPTFNSTYKLSIAKGKNVSAYMQSNGNINVYVNRYCNVYKYVLQKNTSTGQYELSGLANTFQGITGYEEIYDNKAIGYVYNEHKILTNQEF